MKTLQARKSFIANHPKKIEITNKILENRLNSKAITFSPTIKIAEKSNMEEFYILNRLKRNVTYL